MESIRWAFRVGSWQPSKDQWMSASRCVQQEEKERIGRFVFKKDAKSALVGRLLLRRVIQKTQGIPYKDIKLARTDKGKPYLVTDPEQPMTFNFNVSHQGEYAVLAAEPVHQVGIDIMQVEFPKGSRSVEEFFSNMKRQFTSDEWEKIQEPIAEWDQLKQFYRFWCLKESYVKAIGVGIGFSLQRLDFCPQSDPELSHVLSDTKVCVDDVLQKNWRFEETMLDDTHSVAVALQQTGLEPLPLKAMGFQLLSFDNLMDVAEPITPLDPMYWQQFNSKDQGPVGQR